MRGSRFTDAQIIGVVREAAAGVPTAEVCRRHGISPATFSNWKARFGGMGVSEARRLRQLDEEDRKLKQLLAEATLDNHVLRELLRKMSNACRPTRSRAPCPGAVGRERTSRVQADRHPAVGGPLQTHRERHTRTPQPPAHARRGAAALRVSAVGGVAAPGGVQREPQAGLSGRGAVRPAAAAQAHGRRRPSPDADAGAP